MLGLEKEMDIFGIEMAIDEELMSTNPRLNVVIIKEVSEAFNCDKSIVQQILHESLEFQRKLKLCEKTNHNNYKWLVDESYGGPESGYMGFRCKKCGFSDGSRLY